MSIIDTIKEHPIPVVGGVAILLLLMMRSNSGNVSVDNTSAMIAASLQSQGLASQTNVAISGINADVAKSANDAYAYMYTQGVAVAADLAKSKVNTDAALFTNLLISSDQQSATLAQSKVALAGIQAGMHSTDAQMAVAMAQLQSTQAIAFDKSLTEMLNLDTAIRGQIKMQDRMYAGEANLANITGSFNLASLQTQAQHAENIANISAGNDVALARINTGSAERLAGMSASRDVEIANIGYNRDTVIATIGRGQSEALARIEATKQTDLASIDATGSLDRLRESNSGNLALATTNNSYNLDLARTQFASSDYQAGLSAGVANNRTSAAKTSSIVGTIASAAAWIFSDSRLKTNIVHVGKDRKGHNVYEWSYRGSPERHRGYMASEVKQTRPDAVNSFGGFHAVNYGVL